VEEVGAVVGLRDQALELLVVVGPQQDDDVLAVVLEVRPDEVDLGAERRPDVALPGEALVPDRLTERPHRLLLVGEA
jgi:hypothetical protein